MSLEIAAYCVVALESIAPHIPIAFLERIKEEFTKTCGGKAATATAGSMKKKFGPKINLKMKEFTKLTKVNDHVSEVKGVIKKDLDSGEAIEHLVDKLNPRSAIQQNAAALHAKRIIETCGAFRRATLMTYRSACSASSVARAASVSSAAARTTALSASRIAYSTYDKSLDAFDTTVDVSEAAEKTATDAATASSKYAIYLAASDAYYAALAAD